MGSEAKCTARFNGQIATGTARLETDVLQFRGRSTGSRSDRAAPRSGGDVRFSMPFASMKEIAADGGSLHVATKDGEAWLDLGPAAAKWADKIKHPPSRLDKIGVKPTWRCSALGVDDETFLAELGRAVAFLSIGRAVKASDAIFYGVTKEAQLVRLEALKRSLVSNGALWVIRPKGRPEISEGAVMAAGKRAGLVDVKVVSFSTTHTAEKFVIPVAKRSPPDR